MVSEEVPELPQPASEGEGDRRRQGGGRERAESHAALLCCRRDRSGAPCPHGDAAPSRFLPWLVDRAGVQSSDAVDSIRRLSSATSTGSTAPRGRSAVPREDAEDLVQETVARVLARPRRLHGEEELGYLLGALRNTFLSSRRTASRRPQTVAPLEEVVAGDPRTGSPARGRLRGARAVRRDRPPAGGVPSRADRGRRRRPLLPRGRAAAGDEGGDDHQPPAPCASAGRARPRRRGGKIRPPFGVCSHGGTMSTTPDADEQRRIDAVTDAIRSLDVPAPDGLRARVEAMAAGAADADRGAADANRGAADAGGRARRRLPPPPPPRARRRAVDGDRGGRGRAAAGDRRRRQRRPGAAGERPAGRRRRTPARRPSPRRRRAPAARSTRRSRRSPSPTGRRIRPARPGPRGAPAAPAPTASAGATSRPSSTTPPAASGSATRSPPATSCRSPAGATSDATGSRPGSTRSTARPR